jgi:hypothetical protein
MSNVSVLREIPEEDKARFTAVREKAEELGVLDINFSGSDSADSLECYEHTLDIISENKSFLDEKLNATG